MTVRALAATTLVAALLLAGGATAASSPPTVTLDVIAFPGEFPGPVEWKTWRVAIQGPETIRAITLRIPEAMVKADALRAIPAGTRVGTVTLTARQSADSLVTAASALVTGRCRPDDPASGDGTFRFETPGGCATVRLERADGTLTAHLDLALLAGAIVFDLRVDRLFPPNPANPHALDVTAVVETTGGTATAVVREVVGGETQVSVSAAPTTVVYGERIKLSGQVTRAGQPSAGERVVAHEFHFSTANTFFDPVDETVTDTEGRFEVLVRPTSVQQWGAWSAKPGLPPLNTLVRVLPEPLEVRAPRPPIAKRALRRLKAGRVEAEIVVRNPLARTETLQCRLYVGGKQFAFRRFPFRPAPLVFRVFARAGTRIRAAIGRWEGPSIAPGWSRTVRL